MKYGYALNKSEKKNWLVCRRCEISLGTYDDLVWRNQECPGLKDRNGNNLTDEILCTTDFVHYHLSCPYCLYEWTEAAVDIKRLHMNNLGPQLKKIQKLFPKFDEEKLLQIYREELTKDIVES